MMGGLRVGIRAFGTFLLVMISATAVVGLASGSVGLQVAIGSLPVFVLFATPSGVFVAMVSLAGTRVRLLRRRVVSGLLSGIGSAVLGYLAVSAVAASMDLGPYAGGPNDHRDTVVALLTLALAVVGLVTGTLVSGGNRPPSSPPHGQ